MKKIISVMVAALMIASLIPFSASAYIRSGDNGNVYVPYTTGEGITIDGTLAQGEWSETNKLSLDGSETMESWGIGVFDGTIDFYYSWSDAGFYIAAEIYDRYIEDGVSELGSLGTRFQIALNPAGIICEEYAGLFFSFTPIDNSNEVLLMRHNWQTQADDGTFMDQGENGYTGKYTYIKDGDNIVGWNLECIIPWVYIASEDRYSDLDDTDEVYLTNFDPKDEVRERAFCTGMIAYVQCNTHNGFGIASTARTGDPWIWTVDGYDVNFIFMLPGETERKETRPFTYDDLINAPEVIPGDINGDKEVNNKDVVALFRYVSGDDKIDDESVYDYNGDKEVNNKDVVALFRFVSSK